MPLAGRPVDRPRPISRGSPRFGCCCAFRCRRGRFRAVGVNDLALHRRHRYSTVVRYAETHDRIGVLSDRKADTTGDTPASRSSAAMGPPPMPRRHRSVRQSLPATIQASNRLHLCHGLAQTAKKLNVAACLSVPLESNKFQFTADECGRQLVGRWTACAAAPAVLGRPHLVTCAHDAGPQCSPTATHHRAQHHRGSGRMAHAGRMWSTIVRRTRTLVLPEPSFPQDEVGYLHSVPEDRLLHLAR